MFLSFCLITFFSLLQSIPSPDECLDDYGDDAGYADDGDDDNDEYDSDFDPAEKDYLDDQLSYNPSKISSAGKDRSGNWDAGNTEV